VPSDGACFLDLTVGAERLRVSGGLAFLAGAEREALAGTGFFTAPAAGPGVFTAQCVAGGTDVGVFALSLTVMPVAYG